MGKTTVLEVRDSLAVLVKAFPKLLVVSIVVAWVAYGITKRIPSNEEVHFSYIVSLSDREEAPGFRYDGFYALSGTELFSETLASLITSPEVVVQAYSLSDLALPTQDPIRLASNVRAEKAAPQLVQVTVSDTSREKAERLSKGVMQATEKAVQEYNAKNSPSLGFRIVATQPWTGTVRFAEFPIALTLGVFAFVIGCMLALFTQALKRGRG